MELHFTLIAPHRGRGTTRELLAMAARGSSGTELAGELDRLFGVGGITVEGRPLAGLTVGTPPLRSGAILLAGAASGTHPGADPPLVLGIRSGPAAGSVFALPRGVHTVGRGPEASRGRIALPDPELSREHARLCVTETSVRLLDAGSRNGTSVNGRRIHDAVVVRGQCLRVGSSTGSLEVSGGSPLHSTAGRPPGDPLRLVRPHPGRPRLALLAMAAVPLVLGVAMAALTGQWMFLAMSGLSATAALLPLAEGRSARRRFSQDLAQAVDDDLARRLRAAPDAYEIGTQTAGSAAGAAEDVLMLRLGVGRQPADIVVDPSNGSPLPEHESAPVVVPFAGLVTVRGPERNVEGLARFLLLQLASLPGASGRTTVLAGGSKGLRLAARFLPRIRILSGAECGDPARVKAALKASVRCGVLILPGPETAVRAAVAETALTLERPVIDAAGAMDSRDTEIDVGGSPAALRSRGVKTDFVADLVPPRAFAAAARHLGALGRTDDGGALPKQCPLDGVVGLTEHDLAAAWAREESASASIPVPLGLTRAGPLILDLTADGPHMLIAGTTGSGKSELLRSLVASAAASHSPRRLTFLFVDFKGGSGLEPLIGLPHCVGLVSDLDGEIDRTLISLRAEVARRERLLADRGCSDIVDYQRLTGECEVLPRLALVIDEFRMLVEENPEALAEFLRIASIGRSLGLHLIIATQRPQGAVSADIRANVGSVIALRVAGDAESRDIIGSTKAALLPAEAPGRALLAKGSRDPVEFQTASLGLAGEVAARRPLRIMEANEWLEGFPNASSDSVPLTPAESAAGFVEAARRAWEADGGPMPRRPLAEPLPETPVSPSPDIGPSVTLGIADLPHEQRTAVLDWNPEQQGHLAFVGDAAAAGCRALAAAVGRLSAAGPSRYLYLLDADGSLAPLKGHPRVGAYLRPGELRDAARLIARLNEDVSTRAGSGEPTLILAVAGWGSWIAAVRSSAHSATEDALLDLIRRGPAGRVVLVVSGSRDLVASRIFSELPSRLFFPSGTTEESRLGWPRAISSAAPGRAIASGLIAGERPVAVQCFGSLPDQSLALGGFGTPPFRVTTLPTEVTAAQIAGDPRIATGTDLLLAVGVHGDDGEPLFLPLEPKSLLLVLGARRSGKTSLLDALPAMNPGVVWWHRHRRSGGGGPPEGLGSPKPSGSSEGFGPPEASGPLEPSGPPEASGPLEASGSLEVFGPHTASESLEAAVSAAASDTRRGRRAVLLVDDADQLTPQENRLLHGALDAGVTVVATAGYSASLYSACPISLRARDARSGIAIAPRSPSDGDVFRVRVDPPGNVPAGRAIAVIDGRTIDVQLGWLGKDRLSHSG